MKQTDYLLTGASGYLGRVLLETLASSYTVASLSRSSGNTYAVDLASEVPQFRESFKTIIHAAGKAHVIPRTEKEAAEFFRINHTGTLNLIKGLEGLPVLPESFVFISTVAVYGKDSGELVDEATPLLGSTPYAKSKIQAEQTLQEWCNKRNIKLTILRLPLIVAPDPPGNLGALIRMMKKGVYVGIGSVNARKSMVLAEDVAQFIPVIQHTGGIYNLTDGYDPYMVELEHALAAVLKKKKPMRLSDGLLKVFARVGDVIRIIPLNTLKFNKLTATLTFSDSRARAAGWNPRSVIRNLPFG
jgi:nucleoside-diphosphate-sugar epimerase